MIHQVAASISDSAFYQITLVLVNNWYWFSMCSAVYAKFVVLSRLWIFEG